MTGVLITMCAVSALGALVEKVATDEDTKHIIRVGSASLCGALAIGLVVKVIREVIKVSKEI